MSTMTTMMNQTVNSNQSESSEMKMSSTIESQMNQVKVVQVKVVVQ